MTLAEQVPAVAPAGATVPAGDVVIRAMNEQDEPAGAPMRLAIIVTEFPKTTETFILRDLLEFRAAGHELRIYHLTPFRRREVVHAFARPALAWARTTPYLASRRVLGALGRTIRRRPAVLAGIVGEIVRGFRRQPVELAKALWILPKSLAFAEELERWQPDHVHAEFAGHPATCAWIIGRISGFRYSVSCRAHDIFRTQALLSAKLGEAAFVRTISGFNRRFLLERVTDLDPNRLVVIHSSLDARRIEPLPPAPAEPFRIVYVGSLQKRKGVDVLLRALGDADELGDWRLEVIGDGPERRHLLRLARHLGLAGRVSFAGAAPFEQVTSAYARASVVVVPSIIGPGGRTEGIPNVVIEALAYQRPVIASRLSGIPELVIDGETGRLVTPGDAQDLRRALVWVRQQPAAASAGGRRGRARVAAVFDLRVNARAQLRLFRAHAGRGPTA